MTTPVQAQTFGKKVGLMMPPEDYVAASVVIDFTNDSVFTKDLVQEQANLRVPYIQAVYIDNSADANALTLAFDGTDFSIKVKGNTQGVYPLIVPEGPPRFTVTSTQGAVKKTLIFLSMPVPFFQWPTA